MAGERSGALSHLKSNLFNLIRAESFLRSHAWEENTNRSKKLILIFGSDTFFFFKYIFEHHPWVKKEAHAVTIVLPECAEISRSAVNI